MNFLKDLIGFGIFVLLIFIVVGLISYFSDEEPLAPINEWNIEEHIGEDLWLPGPYDGY